MRHDPVSEHAVGEEFTDRNGAEPRDIDRRRHCSRRNRNDDLFGVVRERLWVREGPTESYPAEKAKVRR